MALVQSVFLVTVMTMHWRQSPDIPPAQQPRGPAQTTGAVSPGAPAASTPSPRSPAPAPAVSTRSPRGRAPAPATAQPVPARGSGRLVTVPGSSARTGQGSLQRYSVAVEGGLGVDTGAFAAAVEQTLADPRSWGAGGRRSFQRVDGGDVDFRVVLASPNLTDRLCAPLATRGNYSCAQGATAVINLRRWLRGAAAYTGRLAEYRYYVVNHEVGHVLGQGHASCPGPGRLAPLMMQQTRGVGSCRPNPWPFPA